MMLKIKQDHSRFREIVRGKIKQNLKKYITQGELIGKQGGETISIPLPRIDLPHFVYDHRDRGGTGQGEGDVGDVLQSGNVEPGEGQEAGGEPGEHSLEVDVSFEDLAQMLGEALELPNIEPKGSERLTSDSIRYTGVNSTGPESLRHFKRTFKQALRRQIAMGNYDPDDPIIVPTRDDRRYRSWKIKSEPQTNAAIIYMMDVYDGCFWKYGRRAKGNCQDRVILDRYLVTLSI